MKMNKEVKEGNEKKRSQTDCKEQCRRIFFSLRKSRLDLAFIRLCLEKRINVKDEESRVIKSMHRLRKLLTRLRHLFRAIPLEYRKKKNKMTS